MPTNITFLRDPERSFRVWHISDVFTEELGAVKNEVYIANPNDLVVDTEKDIIYKVVDVDYVSGIPTLEFFNFKLPDTDIVDPDSLPAGLKQYQPHGINRIFIDNSTSPATLSIDSRYRVYGSEATQIRLFKGSDTSNNGTVISHKLNSNGVIVSELVDLVPLYATNNTIKRPARFHTSNELEDGERVTMVIYNANGRVVGEHPFIVRNANMISGPTASNVYISDITLLSDLIDEDDPLLLKNPINVPFSTAMMYCRVHYSNGDHADHAIDGNKVKLHGLTNFNTSIIGPTTNIVLSYYPDPTEPAINLQGTVAPSISKTYKLSNINIADEFTFKLYVIPIWNGSSYRLVWRLTDLAYEADIDVTDHVSVLKTDGTQFRGNDFDREQAIVASLPLDNINLGGGSGHVHVQQLKITLNPPGTVGYDDYVIDYGGDGLTYFGMGHYANAQPTGDRKFKIDINQTNVDDWVSWLYRTLDPIFDNAIVDEAPTPTHFKLEHGGVNGGLVIGTFPTSDWDREFALGTIRSWEQGMPINLVWIVRDNGVDKIVGISPLAVKYTYTGS